MKAIFDRLLQTTQDVEAELIQVRRHLRRNPEISWHEKKTSEYLKQKLELLGLEVKDGYAGYGLSVDFGTITPTNKGIAWRADIDALPIDDQINQNYASVNKGVCHACGHDVHTTIAYGLAKVLHSNPYLIKRPIRIIWQPAEEVTPSGAPIMIKEGILDNVDSIFALHVDPTRKSGTFSVKPGNVTSAIDTFKITIQVESSTHSARPFMGRDPLWILHHIMSFLYSMGHRRTDVRYPSVLSIGQISGGDVANIIPQQAFCQGTIRTSRDSDRVLYREEIQLFLDHMALVHNAKISMEWLSGSPATINDDRLATYVQQAIATCFGDHANDPGITSMGGEDFSNYLKEIPGVFFRVGSQSSDRTAFPLHSSNFDIDEQILAPTVALSATLLLNME